MAAPPVTCVMHTRVPNAKAYTRALEADKSVRVVPCPSEGVSADFICSTGGISVAFVVTPTGTVTSEAAARVAKMRACFKYSYGVSLSGVLPADASPNWVALSGDAGDAARFMLDMARKLVAMQPQAVQTPAQPTAVKQPTANQLVDAVVQMPGVETKAAATALLCASNTLGHLASAKPHQLATVGGITLQQAEAFAAACQQPSQLVMHASPVSYKIT